jgi:uncharacterized membrane protein
MEERIKMLKFNESIVAMIVFLTWLIIMPIIIVRVFNEFAFWAIAMFALVLLGMLVSFLYFRKSSALIGLIMDERTERFSIKASRNGFLMAVVLTTALAAFTWLRGSQSHIEVLDLLTWIWEWAVGAYMLSFLYYVMKD